MDPNGNGIGDMGAEFRENAPGLYDATTVAPALTGAGGGLLTTGGFTGPSLPPPPPPQADSRQALRIRGSSRIGSTSCEHFSTTGLQYGHLVRCQQIAQADEQAHLLELDLSAR